MSVRVRVQTPSGIVAAPVEELSRWLSDAAAWVWVDLHGDRESAERLLLDVFGFHPVIVRDSLEEVRHPRVHGFEDYLYLVVHGVKALHAPSRPGPEPAPEAPPEPPEPPERASAPAPGDDEGAAGLPAEREFRTVELDVFLGARFLVTYHLDRIAAIDEARRRSLLPESPGMAGGPVSLLRDVLDTLVDQYDLVLDRFDAELGQLESRILEEPRPDQLSDLLRMKRSLQRMRRINGHQQATMLRLARGEFPQVPERERLFFRDISDRLARVSDMTETYRETASALLDTHISSSSNRVNEVMRTLTVVTLLLMPPTLIAGVYGMNFARMPELGWAFGYPLALALMGGSAWASRWWLKKRGLMR